MEDTQIKKELNIRLRAIENAALRARTKILNNDINISYEMGEIKQYLQSSTLDWKELIRKEKDRISKIDSTILQKSPNDIDQNDEPRTQQQRGFPDLR